MKPLQSADLRSRITILREGVVDNGHGEDVPAWAPIATVWAEVLGQNGREAIVGQVLQGLSVFRIRIWYRDDIKAADQIKVGTLDLNITAPPADPFGDRRELMIWASTASAVKIDG